MLTALIDTHYVPETQGSLIIFYSDSNNGQCHEKRRSDSLHVCVLCAKSPFPAYSVAFVCMRNTSLKEVRISSKVTRQEGSRART